LFINQVNAKNIRIEKILKKTFWKVKLLSCIVKKFLSSPTKIYFASISSEIRHQKQVKLLMDNYRSSKEDWVLNSVRWYDADEINMVVVDRIIFATHPRHYRAKCICSSKQKTVVSIRYPQSSVNTALPHIRPPRYTT